MGIAQAAAVVDQRFRRPAQHVNEAGRDRLSFGVYDASRGDFFTGRHQSSDAVTVDRDIQLFRRIATAVVDQAAGDDEVVLVRKRLGRAGGQQDRQK